MSTIFSNISLRGTALVTLYGVITFTVSMFVIKYLYRVYKVCKLRFGERHICLSVEERLLNQDGYFGRRSAHPQIVARSLRDTSVAPPRPQTEGLPPYTDDPPAYSEADESRRFQFVPRRYMPISIDSAESCIDNPEINTSGTTSARDVVITVDETQPGTSRETSSMGDVLSSSLDVMLSEMNRTTGMKRPTPQKYDSGIPRKYLRKNNSADNSEKGNVNKVHTDAANSKYRKYDESDF